MSKQNKTRNTGEELECEVERIYQLFGGITERRVLIKGYEIDVFAIISTGPIKFSVLVECKDYKKEKRVSDIEMRSFALKLLAARECGKADKGVFIATGKYSKTALATANKHNIQCLTLEDLYNQLVDFQDYIQSTIDEFALSDLVDWYIEQTGSDIEDFDSLTKKDSKVFLHKPLMNYVDEIFNKKQEKRLALLGNFGTGKTSFCLKYRDVLFRRHLTDPSQRIPVFINLRDFRSGIDIHRVIADHLQQLPSVQINLKLCLELQRMGRFFFLLDGLDEMATKVDRTVINENLREIERLYSDYDNVYLLTCRTHFFQERIADEFLKGYRVIYLVEWGQIELEEYLKKRFGEKWSKYHNQITATPNLEELSKTPLLLDMIAKSLTKIKKEETYEINSSILYSTYTNEWIYKQSKRRGAVMSSTQRREFVEKFAVMLFKENRTEIHFSELYHVAREFSGLGDPTKLDYFDTDARTCTFITKDSNGNYSFRHRSFMEYFCASSILNEINSEQIETLTAKPLQNEIIHFIGGMRIAKKEIESLQKWSTIFKNEHLSKNAVKILMKLGKPLQKKVEKHFGLSRTKFEESLWKALAFDDEAMNEFTKKYYSELKNLVQFNLKHMNIYDYDADDILQNLFLRLLTLKDKVEDWHMEFDVARINEWLLQTLKNIVMDRYRLTKFENEISTQTFSQKYFPERGADHTDEYIGQVDIEKIRKAVEMMDLSKASKQAFTMYYIENKSIKEISDELGLNPKAIHPMLYRARKLLRKQLLK